MKYPILFLVLLLFALSCTNETEYTVAEAQSDQLGTVELRFSGSEAAQPHFKKGLLLLHNFEFKDARAAFLEAQAIDSTFVMAYWGEAMTHNHPLWREQAFEEGQATLKKLAETPEERQAKATSDLEKDFLSGVEILYGEGSKYQRDSTYSAHLQKMYEKYPGNQEVGAFYALSILGAVPVGRDVEAYEKSAAIVSGIIEENPEHPGALHYLIHSYDDPVHAPLALSAANAYSKVAADAAHALHMPSHIYVSVGMWEEVVASNIASWNSSVKRKKAKDLDNDALSYHALHWQMYGLLNLGRHEEAAQLMREMKKYTDKKPSKVARRYFIGMKGNYLVETQDWESDIANYDIDRKDMNISHRAVYAFLEGQKAFMTKDSKTLANIIEAFQKERAKAALLVSEEGIPMCSAAGSNRYAPNQADLDQADVLKMELLALQSWESPAAEEWLKKATALEANINYSFGPPYIAQPSFELYGKWLLEQGRAEEAAAQFAKALERGPKRLSGLSGQLAAAKKTGIEPEKWSTELKNQLKKADEGLRQKLLSEGLLSQNM